MKVTDDMVDRFVDCWPIDSDQAREVLEHVLGGEPEPVPEWSLDKVIPRLLAAVEAGVQKPPSKEERLRNLRDGLAAEIFKEHEMIPSPIGNRAACAEQAFSAADAFIAEMKRRS